MEVWTRSGVTLLLHHCYYYYYYIIIITVGCVFYERVLIGLKSAKESLPAETRTKHIDLKRMREFLKIFVSSLARKVILEPAKTGLRMKVFVVFLKTLYFIFFFGRHMCFTVLYCASVTVVCYNMKTM